jgi:hypothetical protein
MAYLIGQDLGLCFVADRAVALDLRSGRYRGVGPRRATALKKAVASGEGQVLMGELRAAGLIGTEEVVTALPVPWTAPKHSASEEQCVARSSPIRALEVAWDVIRTWVVLRVKPFSWIVARRRKLRLDGPSDVAVSSDRVRELAQQFLRVRRLAPIEPVCLLDSLALAAFLARRGVDVDVVLAVDLNPFEAHAWVQRGDWALNETAHRAAMLTPILVI